MGITTVDSGRLLLDGVDLAGPGGRTARQRIGYAPQEEALYAVLSGRDNLTVFGQLHGLRGRELSSRIDEVADALLIGDLLDRPCRELSGGQRRRLHNAIALVGHPDVVLLDEPTAGVDPETRTAILDVVRTLARRDGTAVCYATHYLPEIESLDAHVVILDRGRVVGEGSIAELLRAYAVSWVDVRFEGDAPDVHVPGGMVRRDGARMRIELGRPQQSVAAILELLGEHRHRVRGIDVIDADLESVFLTLTGRSFLAAQGGDPDGTPT
jgi:ABC-2 type transport system ATP-binding protein